MHRLSVNFMFSYRKHQYREMVRLSIGPFVCNHLISAAKLKPFGTVSYFGLLPQNFSPIRHGKDSTLRSDYRGF